MAFADSQNILPDVYPVLALAARATERLKLMTGVSNSFTRHPAVTASAAMTIQKMSLGRFRLEVGRGTRRQLTSDITLRRYERSSVTSQSSGTWSGAVGPVR